MTDLSVLDCIPELPRVTGENLVAEVRRLAADDPTRVYGKCATGAACSNVNSSDQPGRGCIIGEALMALDVPREVLTAMEKADHCSYPTGVTGTNVISTLVWLDITITRPQLDWLCRIQNRQDQYMPWADCVVEADRLYGLAD